ncbi:hypothetical protein [Salinicoccus sp. HZC-1]|uniref:hypothetical protein n=1 Tax=Salinicoccus sp. HZC-1 TaxID=3385497 RepID=UPI00398B5207
MHDIILLRALNLTYAKEPVKFKDRMLGRVEGLMLKDVTFHLYKGEVLGILSDYESLYYLKEVVSGTLDVTKGKIKTKSSILSLDVMDHIHHRHPVSIFVAELLDEYMKPGAVKDAIEELKEQPLFRKTWTIPVKDLSRREIALILIEISKVTDAEIIIYCNMYRHLTKQDAEMFKKVVNNQEKAERGILLLESDIEPISTLANYFVWISYGQTRYDGSVKKGVDTYNDYMRKKSQLKSLDEEALFDLEWKQNVSEYARYKHSLKRLSRKQTGVIDGLNIRKIIISVVLLFIMMMSSFIIFMDINFTGSANTNQDQTVTVPDEEAAIDRTYYALTAEDEMKLGDQVLSHLSLVEVESNQEENYTVILDGEEFEVDADKLIYFNPASLYPDAAFESLLPYTNERFVDAYQFYSKYLGREKSAVVEDFDLSSSDERHASVSGFPVTYHFRNGGVFSMTLPASNIEGLYKEFGIESEDVIFRMQGGGYMILDASSETWVYIKI